MHPDDADDLDFDEFNEAHLSEGGVSTAEVMQVRCNQPVWVPNKKGRAGTWLMVGRTNGGRALFVPVIVDDARSRVRPISGQTCEKSEVERWLKS